MDREINKLLADIDKSISMIEAYLVHAATFTALKNSINCIQFFGFNF
jgi:hypothetical protein